MKAEKVSRVEFAEDEVQVHDVIVDVAERGNCLGETKQAKNTKERVIRQMGYMYIV